MIGVCFRIRIAVPSCFYLYYTYTYRTFDRHDYARKDEPVWCSDPNMRYCNETYPLPSTLMMIGIRMYV